MDTKLLLTVEEAMETLSTSRSTLYKLMRAGLPVVKLGHSTRIPTPALRRWVEEHTRERIDWDEEPPTAEDDTWSVPWEEGWSSPWDQALGEED